MKKIINMFYLEQHEVTTYSTGLLFELEDGSTVEVTSTDPVGYTRTYDDKRLK